MAKDNSMDTVIGRKEEKKILSQVLASEDPELVAIYGRRRVGKTFLIQETFKDHMVFEFAGIHGASMAQQLENFSKAMQRAAGSPLPVLPPANWIQAFSQLETIVQPKLKKGKAALFFDEFPWINSPRSGFLETFAHFWNTWCTRQNNLAVVICGSAAAWMIRNVVNNKGGLHNRISRKIRLMPFSLAESEAYLKSRHINLDRYQILQIYMTIGGIPQYLKNIKPGQSAVTVINELCFARNGLLRGEFNNLYQSLFDKAEHHMSIIKALAANKSGLTRNEIIKTCKLSTGGTTTRLMEELIESGFIAQYVPFNKDIRESIYKVTDEYSLFYLKFMDGRTATAKDTWDKMSGSSSWKSWSGYAFESICLKHIKQIKEALGIPAVITQESAWRYVPGKGENGAQIDLLINRQDHCINLCEMKFSLNEFTIDPAYAKELKNKVDVFRDKARTRKTLFLTMITTHGVKHNAHYLGLVQQDFKMDILFLS
ncbi:ATP-binding protein [Asinibacterium sp. OR53]|uniref:AAA family ATPase n=1 Tax=Asinibacterium sp. OR53 TaxID=925409 RepID=UPI001E4B0188|nr:ATP-binding protein [Asinibacterium sp. OR53]